MSAGHHEIADYAGNYEFVGGPYDGRSMPVTHGWIAARQIQFHDGDESTAYDLYELRDDGRFHWLAYVQPSAD